MNSSEIFSTTFSALSAAGREPVVTGDNMPVRVKALSERDRRRLLMHFLALSADDRLLRFGMHMSDDAITKYVQHLDFTRDTIFGVYNDAFRLSGVGHLAYAPRDAWATLAGATDRPHIAEFGLSVLASARGAGIGSKLFARAAVHCRNADVDTLHMQCLATNRTMLHIARKAGMEIRSDYGEANAYLKLPPADPASMLREAVEEQVAVFDYTFKANARMARKWWTNLARFRGSKSAR